MERKKIAALISSFRNIPVLVIGDAMIDHYVIGKVDRISPEAPVPVVNVEREEWRLGGSANVALNLTSLGAKTFLCGLTGKDSDGKLLRKLCTDGKINSEALVEDSMRPTTKKTRILSDKHQLLRYDQELTTDANSKAEKKLINTFDKIIQQKKPRLVILEDYNKGVLTPRLISHVIETCNQKKIITTVDPKHNRFFEYQGVTVFKPNLRELKEAYHLSAIDSAPYELLKLSKRLSADLKGSSILITLGEKGSFYLTKTRNEIIPSQARDVADVSGAGDTVIAVVSLALAAGNSFHDSVDLANLAGGLVCEHAGVVPVTPAMLTN